MYLDLETDIDTIRFLTVYQLHQVDQSSLDRAKIVTMGVIDLCPSFERSNVSMSVGKGVITSHQVNHWFLPPFVAKTGWPCGGEGWGDIPYRCRALFIRSEASRVIGLVSRRRRKSV